MTRISQLWQGRRLLIACCIGVVCSSACRQGATDPNVVATFDGGQVAIQEVEAWLRQEAAGAGREPAAAVDWPTRYRQTARSLAIDKILLGDAGNDLEELERALGDSLPELRCEVQAEALLAEQPLEVEPPSTEQVEAFYDQHQEVFEKGEQRLVWHLFLRHGESSSEQETLDRLSQLSSRVAAGESFRRLAERHSESENQQIGGHLGWVVPGRLPPDLEDVVYALPAGGTSEPLKTKGGAFLVHVSDILPAVEWPEGLAKRASWERLQSQALLEALEARVAEVSRQDAMILEREELLDLVQSSSAEHVLSVDGVTLTGFELDKRAREQQAEVEFDDRATSLWEAYRWQVARLLLCRQAESSGSFDDQRLADRRDELIQQRGEALLLEQRLEVKTRRLVDGEAKAVQQFYRDNQFLYQTPLQLRVEGLTLAPGDDPEATQARLLAVREQLADGKLDLETAAELLAADVISSRWLGPVGLSVMEPKVRAYLTGTTADSGYVVPFQLGGQLQLLHIIERREPEAVPFDRVEERVREDYYSRHRQRLFVAMSEQLLRDADFELRPRVIEQHLDKLGLAGSEPTDS